MSDGESVVAALKVLILALFVGAVATVSCSSGEPVDRLVAELDDTNRREHAIDALLVLVRQAPEKRRPKVRRRVVHALMDAYRQDTARPQIVAALALLRDPAAEQVFVAALKDADRDGAYFEAAVRSARLIGELGLKRQVPTLITTLGRALKSPRQDRNTWLERSLVRALERLGDRRAVPVLIRILKSDPAQLDFYVSRLAAHALGVLGDPSAADALIASLGATRHGLLLFEESRRALCRIGPPAFGRLITAAAKRDQRRPAKNAAAALKVLADLGAADLKPRIVKLDSIDDPVDYRLALAETLLRLGSSEGEKVLMSVLKEDKTSITARRHAAELLGWYGVTSDRLMGRMKASCSKRAKPAAQLSCWSVALAHSRIGGAAGLEALDKLRGALQDEASQRQLQVYRERLVLVKSCGERRECYEEQLQSAQNWRVRERAALELGRLGSPGVVGTLATRLPKAHPQVARAILVGLERLAPVLKKGVKVVAAVDEIEKRLSKQTSPHGAMPPDLISRAQCLAERLKRREK